MEPKNEAPLQLPPVGEQSPQSANGIPNQEAAPAAPEKTSSSEAVSQGPTGAAPSLPTIPLPISPVPPTAASQTITTSNLSNGLQASDDSDLIEKEWVNKAKLIVEHTRDDPYKQSEELTVFKADYMKKRYDKAIKVNK